MKLECMNICQDLSTVVYTSVKIRVVFIFIIIIFIIDGDSVLHVIETIILEEDFFIVPQLIKYLTYLLVYTFNMTQ